MARRWVAVALGQKVYIGPLSGTALIVFLEKDSRGKDYVSFSPDLTPVSLAIRVKEAPPADILGVLRKATNYTFPVDGSMRPCHHG